MPATTLRATRPPTDAELGIAAGRLDYLRSEILTPAEFDLLTLGGIVLEMRLADSQMERAWASRMADAADKLLVSLSRSILR